MTILAGISGVALVVIVALFAFAAWTRRSESRPDRPGERTCATFLASVEDEDAGDPRGHALATLLCAKLAERGIAVDAPDLADHQAWAFVAAGAWVELVQTEEDQWALTIAERSGGGPGPITVACAIDDALRRIEAVSRLRWHTRESFDPFVLDRGHAHPTDGPIG